MGRVDPISACTPAGKRLALIPPRLRGGWPSEARSGGANWQSHAEERTPPRPSPKTGREIPTLALPEKDGEGDPHSGTRPEELRRQHLADLADKLAQMERLRQHLRLLGRRGIRIERHRGTSCDEHDLDVGVEFRRPPCQFD